MGHRHGHRTKPNFGRLGGANSKRLPPGYNCTFLPETIGDGVAGPAHKFGPPYYQTIKIVGNGHEGGPTVNCSKNNDDRDGG